VPPYATRHHLCSDAVSDAQEKNEALLFSCARTEQSNSVADRLIEGDFATRYVCEVLIRSNRTLRDKTSPILQAQKLHQESKKRLRLRHFLNRIQPSEDARPVIAGISPVRSGHSSQPQSDDTSQMIHQQTRMAIAIKTPFEM
jgi:hypothetical protein